MSVRRVVSAIPLGPCFWVAAGWHLGVWCQRWAAALNAEIERNR